MLLRGGILKLPTPLSLVLLRTLTEKAAKVIRKKYLCRLHQCFLVNNRAQLPCAALLSRGCGHFVTSSILYANFSRHLHLLPGASRFHGILGVGRLGHQRSRLFVMTWELWVLETATYGR